MDGITSRTNYKQSFADPNVDNTYVFTSFMCPLLLKNKASKTVIYENLSPGNEPKCRSIFIYFLKETAELTEQILNKIMGELTSTLSININLQNGSIANLKISGHSTMMDGKCLNVLMGNSATTRCHGCFETFKIFKDFYRILRKKILLNLHLYI